MATPEEILLLDGLIRKALEGNEEATKVYCGSYTLVAKDGQFFRCKGDIPFGYLKVLGVYDLDGYLLPKFWSLPRV